MAPTSFRILAFPACRYVSTVLSHPRLARLWLPAAARRRPPEPGPPSTLEPRGWCPGRKQTSANACLAHSIRSRVSTSHLAHGYWTRPLRSTLYPCALSVRSTSLGLVAAFVPDLPLANSIWCRHPRNQAHQTPQGCSCAAFALTWRTCLHLQGYACGHSTFALYQTRDYSCKQGNDECHFPPWPGCCVRVRHIGHLSPVLNANLDGLWQHGPDKLTAQFWSEESPALLREVA